MLRQASSYAKILLMWSTICLAVGEPRAPEGPTPKMPPPVEGEVIGGDKEVSISSIKIDNEALDVKKRDHDYFADRPFFKLSPIRVPIVQHGVWKGDLFCRISCEVKNNDDYLLVAKIFYTLVDEVYTKLYTFLSEKFIVKSPLDTNVWRPLLQEVIEKYIPLKGLYFRQFVLMEYHNQPPTSQLRTSSSTKNTQNPAKAVSA